MVHPSQFTAETLKDYDGPSYTIRASSVGGQIIEVAMTYFNTTCYFFGDGDEPHPLDHVWIAYSEDISVGARVKAEGNEDLLDTLQEEGYPTCYVPIAPATEIEAYMGASTLELMDDLENFGGLDD